MSKPLRTTVTMATLALGLGGCSWFGGHPGPAYSENAATQALAVPPNLMAPKTSSTYAVPSAQGLGPAPGAAAATTQPAPSVAKPGVASVPPPQAGVVPTAVGIHLVNQGDNHWLTVQAVPDAVWPYLVAYCKSVGFKLTETDAKTGVIRTDWRDGKYGVPKGLTGRLFSGLYDSGTRERLVIRLVSDHDGAASLVYLSYQGAIEEKIGSGAMHWQWAKPTPGKEATELQALMNYLASHIPHAQLSAMPAPGATAPAASAGPTSVAHTGAAPVSAGSTSPSVASGMHTDPADYKILDVNEQPVMRSALPFTTAWAQIGTALQRVNFVVDKADEGKGLYHVTFEGHDDNGYFGNLFGPGAVLSKGAKFIIAVKHHKGGVQVEADNPMMLPVETGGAQGILEMIRGGMIGPHRQAAAAKITAAQQQSEMQQSVTALHQAQQQTGVAKATYRIVDESQEPVLVTSAPFSVAWPEVAVALLHSNYLIDAHDRAKGTYQVTYVGKSQKGSGGFMSNMFDGGPVLFHGVHFRIYVQQVDKQVWVHAQNPMGLPMPAHGARSVLESFQPALSAAG
ncbi:outer membrane protein assembly factor BamC [Acidihalobacter aeolianus]|uniref:outer membrane protein assembly factor BamC n=1 Tax=Acidihalobacter aeolianus TaxID=2792603 RepID=UPI0018D2F0C1|nr:outer membrane protein assembly factor BamC [Acidihalobacter aeolianus]